MECKHDLAERETAVVDGYCPICLRQQLADVQAEVSTVRAWAKQEQDKCSQWMTEAEKVGAENDRLRDAIRWALGENGEFPIRKDNQGAYWWRTELRKRSGLNPTQDGR